MNRIKGDATIPITVTVMSIIILVGAGIIWYMLVGQRVIPTDSLKISPITTNTAVESSCARIMDHTACVKNPDCFPIMTEGCDSNETQRELCGIGESRGIPCGAVSNGFVRCQELDCNSIVGSPGYLVPCSLITDENECLERDGCFRVGECSCSHDFNRARKCGFQYTGFPCFCVTDAFVRCEDLNCKELSETDTNIPCGSIMNEDSCLKRQGCLAKDSCPCVTENNRTKKCGFSVIDIVCDCDLDDGFKKCVDLACARD